MAQSETILTENTHLGDSSIQTVTGEKYKGDGYYGRSDGLHTVQIDVNSFLGNIEMQGTLAVNPTEDDWFTVRLGSGQTIDTTGKIVSATTTKLEYTANETSSKSYNFTGNYVWIRAKISNWTDGTVSSIQLNH
jgi:hypothetical protein